MTDLYERLERMKQGKPAAESESPAGGGDIYSRIEAMKQTAESESPTAQADTAPRPNSGEAEKPNAWDKVKDFLSFTGEKVASGAVEGVEGGVNAFGYFQQFLGEGYEMQAANALGHAGAVSGNEAIKAQAQKQQKEALEHRDEDTKTIANFGDRYAQKVDEKYDTENRSKAGQFVGNVAEGIGGIVPALISNFIVPGSGLVVMGAGAFGNAMQEAKAQGKTDAEALPYAVATAAVETAAEKLLGGMGGAFGKGALDDVVKGAINSKVSSGAARAGLNALVSFLGEGAEEFITEYGNALANRLTIDTDRRTGRELLSDAFYSGLVGGAVGGLLNAADIYRSGKSITATEAAEAAAVEIAASAGAETKAASVPDENSKTDESRPDSPGLTKEEILVERDADGKETFFDINNLARNKNEATPERYAAGNADGFSQTGDASDARIARPEQEVKGVGGAAIDTVANEQPYATAPNIDQATTRSNWMDDELRNEDTGTHRVINERESLNAWEQVFERDENGNINNYNESVEALLSTPNWTGRETDAAMLLMQEARRRGDMNTYRTLANVRRDAVGEAGRTLQSQKKWIAESGDNIVATAAETLSETDERAANETLEVVNELAAEYDSAGQDADRLIDLIRRTAEMRHTTGLFSRRLSRTAEWALRSVVKDGNLEFLRTLAANGIANIASDRVRPTAIEAVRSYRYLAMLSKASTTMRNLISNGVFDGIDTLSRDISVPIDMALSAITGTRSLAVDRGILSREKWRGTLDGLARSVLEVGLDVDTTGIEGRYESTANRTFHMSGGVMSRLMSTWEKWNGYMLQTTDAAARGGTEAEIQRGINSLYNRGLIRDDSLQNAGQTEAAYRTFQDDTAVSRFALGARNALNEFSVGGMGVGDVALPFARTPANLVSRAFEYSPLGVLRGGIDLFNVLRAAHNGNLSAADQARAVQEIGRGLNGTALIALSAWLSYLGIIKTLGNGRDDEDKDKAAYAKMRGEYGTQINIDAALRAFRGESTKWQDGDTLMSIGFLEPLNAQLTTGALIAEDWKNEDMATGARLWEALKASPEGAVKAVLDMPVMSVFKDAAQAYEYSEADTSIGKIGDALGQFGASQLTSLIPNAVKGVAQGTDPIQRNAYTGDNLWEQTLANIKASVPGFRQQVAPKIDSFGNEMETEGGTLGFLNANVLPGYVTHYKEQTGENVLDRIYELTGNAGVYPDRKAPGSVTATISGKEHKIELDGEAKQKYLVTAGQAHEEFVAAAENDRDFLRLSTDKQEDILNTLRLTAQADAKAELFASEGLKYPQSATDKVIDRMTPSQYIDWLVEDATARVPTGYKSNPAWQQFEMAADVLPQNLALSMMVAANEKAGQKVSAAVQQGVALDDAVAYYRAITEYNAEGKTPTKGEKQQRIAGLGLSAQEAAVLAEVFG